MAKEKKSSKAAVAAPAPAASKPPHSVKAGRVTKPADQAKAVAKESAKKTAKKVEKKSKKVKEPTPEPSSEEEDTSASSASSDVSDSDSESEVETKAAPKTNGTSKAAVTNKEESDDDDTSEGTSDASSDDEAVNVKAGAAKNNDDESSDSDSSSDDDDEEEEDMKAPNAKSGDVGMADANGSSAESSSDEESSEDEAPPKVEEKPAKKRKAEEAIAQTPKKTKVTINGEEKEAVGNLFIGNLSWNVDEEWLTREFEEFGELQGVRIITDRDSGRSKGFGYVEFVNTASAVAAVEAKQGFELDGRGMRLDFSNPRPAQGDGATPQQRSSDRAQKYGDAPKEPSDTLFVGNLSFDVDESTLSEYFQEHGSVQSIRLPTDRDTGNLKGFGYVQFTSIDEAKTAFDALQGADVLGRAMRLDFAGAKPSNDSGRGGFGGRGDRGGRGRGGFGDRGGRGGGRGFGGDRGRGGRGRGGDRGGRGGGSFNRGGFGDFSGKKTTF